MGAIEDTYADLETDEVSLDEFREAVAEKVEQMGGLADDETAAMLLAHELQDGEVNGIADVTPEMDDAKFVGKAVSVGELRTFERDEEDTEDGRVLNVDVADESGTVRVSLWDEQAANAAAELQVGDVIRVAGRPKDGYNGVEVSADRVEPDPDTDVDVQIQDAYRVEDLSVGLSDVTLVGEILDTDAVRTFDRDDGSQGRVANLSLGDETGRVTVTLWDDGTEAVETFEPGDVVEIIDGYVRERDGSIELHVGNQGTVEAVDDDVEFVPESTPIGDLEMDDVADIAGVIRSVDEKRTFERDDGSEGQVRNVRLQDDSGDIRVALWGEKADRDIGPGDEVLFTDVEIQDGWQDDIEASAGWRASVVELADGATTSVEESESSADERTGLDAYADGTAPESASGHTDTTAADSGTDTEDVEFTGTVVQARDPVILDDGTETMSVETNADVTLGQTVTVRGTLRDDRLDAEEVR
ncbi:replication factor A (ssDNA-binding protein) [Halarchaeum acidiphilum MH1-52-1]|uniref:Replication factor A (SsDNA-binding protein) n=1 Tax=Halarchaeum acidiphilum MH1-52-1 TaxID=1261545 RepID=U3AAV0_9EURY|nr:single-stranded DNA binding protein [Halarchaeum acidiphilum]GAD51878.1 replication factor A (ssDNA-binding protein) [Halarchaeum acidiphilum MH1-52-1]